MGMDLMSHDGAPFRFGHSAWIKVLMLAQAYGWDPAGTIPPRHMVAGDLSRAEQWTGRYDSNEGQVVAAGDAVALADALERALPAVPEESQVQLTPEQREIQAVIAAAFDSLSVEERALLDLNPADPALPPIEFFGGHRGKLRGFAEFCRRGQFEIW